MKHSEVRQNIIKTASFLFYRNGYNLTGINEIISETGIAKATLYNHFKSKEDICIAYLQFKNTTFLSDIRAFCLAEAEGNAQILALFGFLQSFFKDKDFNGCWCIKTVAEIPLDNQRMRTEIQAQKKAFLDFIIELAIANLDEVSTEDAESLAKQIYLLYEGAVAESHLHQEDWPIHAAKKICAKIIV